MVPSLTPIIVQCPERASFKPGFVIVNHSTKIVSPCRRNSSTMPATRGASGPTTVRSIRLSRANWTRRGISSELMFRLSPSFAVPAFPGAQKTSSTLGDCFSFQTKACSRPPEPTTRILIAHYFQDKTKRLAAGYRESFRFSILTMTAVRSVLEFSLRSSHIQKQRMTPSVVM